MSMMITEADIGPLKPKFPQKLYSLLGMEDVQHTITWLPDGRFFKLLDEKEFMRTAAPRFFKHSAVRSFYRQLQLWGFERVRKGPNKGAWHHKYFIRDDPDKMRRIERVKIKGKATITVDSDTYSPYLLGVSPRMLIPPSVVVDTPPGTTAPAMVMMMPMQQQGMVAAPQPEMMMQTTYAANADIDQKSMSLPSVVHTTSPTSVMNSSPKSDTMTMSTMPPQGTKFAHTKNTYYNNNIPI